MSALAVRLVTAAVTIARHDGEAGVSRIALTACGTTSDPGGTRTHDLRIKSPLLYQLSYRVVRQHLT